MTMNPRVRGLRAPRQSVDRALRRVVAAAAALFVAAALVLVPGTQVRAAEVGEALTFAMAPRADGVLSPGQSLLIALTADNRSSSSVHGGEVMVSLGRAPLADRAAVAAWLGPDRPDVAVTELAEVAFEVIPPLGERTMEIMIPAAQFGSEDLTPGVYPLLATYTSDQRVKTAAAVVTVPDDTTAEAGVAVVVPLTAKPTGAGLLTADELALATGESGALRDQLDAVTGTDVILAVDPAIPAAIRALGARAPESAVLWLEDLLALPNERFALEFGDADLAAQVHSGLARPLTVPTLASYLDPADFADVTPEPEPEPEPSPSSGAGAGATAGTTGGPDAVPATPTTTPTPTPTPDAPDDAEPGALPDTDALLSIGTTVGPVLWPATGTAGADVVETLGAAISDQAPYVLVPSTASAAAGSRAIAGEAQLLVYDAEVSAALRDASRAVGDIARAGHLAAATAFARFAPAGSTLLVTVDRAGARTGDALRDAIETAEDLPGRTTVDFDEIASARPVPTSIVDIEPEAARVTVLTSLRDDESALASFATILADPTLITGPERASMLQLLGNGWRVWPDAWTDEVAAHTAATRATLDAVGIVPPSDQVLLGSSAPMRVAIRNDLPWPVSLVLLAHPSDARLVVQSTTPVDAGPQQNTRVEVPVEARVGSGESSIDMRLRSPTMVAVGDEVRVAVSVRAEWEGVGVVVMAVAVAGMLAIGILRTVGRVRARRAARAGEGGDAGAADRSDDV
ncbi:DUF6049 family protein [Microbacterium sp. MC2]